ncbi:MAG: LysM peptidoglycan-binding domain-containing protein [Anaerovibrio sp.]|uniref:LysM peptidoglycan-binding domain-containing protein n=1 Tax=Anaerovibrio sp. TaxID=1872532 RepID=UPI0025CF3F3F|nr:LysM peptidoglycan-binding domain-containing protein [Anaerovibrio sp.]MCR5175712.1 LysM peptidoglycan-binding domain-containing protein [Anaerovibrio sp.]
MKNLIVAIIVGIAVLAPLNLTNAYLRCSEFDTVVIHYGDSVENIASRYTDDKDEVRELTEAIIEINDIKNPTKLKAGKKIQVPVLAKEKRDVQVAVR